MTNRPNQQAPINGGYPQHRNGQPQQRYQQYPGGQYPQPIGQNGGMSYEGAPYGYGYQPAGVPVKQKKPLWKKLAIALAVIVLLGGIGSAISSGGSEKTKARSENEGIAAKNSPENSPEESAQDAEVPSPSAVPEQVVETESVEGEASPENDVPAEWESALRSAKSYSDFMHMSKRAIFDQLTSEYGDKFPQEAAQYAIDNLQADYNANALKAAENYSEMMHLSKRGIYDQLTSEFGDKFTAEEAQYAVDNLQADYNTNALASAKNYQQMMSMSNEAIFDQLTSEYGDKFTPEEAQYAIEHLNG